MDRDVLKQLLDEGKSHREIAKILNIGKSTVGYWANKYGLMSINHPPKHAISFNKIDTPEKAYILGFILADGNINLKNDVELSISKVDRCVIEFISSILESEVALDDTYNKEKRRFPRARTSRRIKDILKFTGGRLKEDRHYPIVKRDLERFLLLGFFDGDGCVSWGYRKDRNRLWCKVSFTSQLHLLEGIQQMLYKTLNISSVIRPKKGENCYIIEFSNKENVLKFIDFIYPNENFIILQRKYLKAKALRLELEEFGGTTIR